MAKQLKTTVYVVAESGEGHAAFGPGDEVPAWAAKQITNPAAWADEEPEAPVKAPAAKKAAPRKRAPKK